MSNLGYKQVVNADRRTWDKEAYEARAKARQSNLENELDHKAKDNQSSSEASKRHGPLHKDDEKEEFMAATAGAAGPGISKRAFLKARTRKVNLESKVGQSEIISAEALSSNDIDITDGVTKSSTGIGWHCKVCDCFLKDSLTYLDHINGKKHQRKLGYTMRVERSTVDQVKDRMANLAKTVKSKKKSLFSSFTKKDDSQKESKDGFEAIVKAKDDEELHRKAARARKREERKKKRQQEEEEEDEEFDTGMDPAMAAMMGFSSFK